MSPLPTNDDLKYGQGFRGIDTTGGKTLPVCVGHGADLVGHIPRDSKLMMQDSSRTLDGYTPAMRGRSIACHVVWLTNRHGDPRAYKLLTFFTGDLVCYPHSALVPQWFCSGHILAFVCALVPGSAESGMRLL